MSAASDPLAAVLTALDACLGGASKLDLKGLGLSALPEFLSSSLPRLAAVDFVDLSGNPSLRELPAELGAMASVRTLFALGCGFGAVPEVLGRLPALSMLSFKSNRLEVIPEGSLPPTVRYLVLVAAAVGCGGGSPRRSSRSGGGGKTAVILRAALGARGVKASVTSARWPPNRIRPGSPTRQRPRPRRPALCPRPRCPLGLLAHPDRQRAAGAAALPRRPDSWSKMAPNLCEDTAPCPTQAFLEEWAAPVHSDAQPW